jgi:segregation and condensation protein A
MAAYLLEYKSKRLLPINEEIIIEQDQQSDIESSLMAHLEEYAFYKNVAVALKQKKEIFERVYARHEGESIEKEFELQDLSLKDLVIAFKKIYEAAQKRDSIRTISDEEITLEKRIEEICALLESRSTGVALDEIFFVGSRIEIVVSFLAILELAKQGFLRIAQDQRFQTIYLFKKGGTQLGPDHNASNTNTAEINS